MKQTYVLKSIRRASAFLLWMIAILFITVLGLGLFSTLAHGEELKYPKSDTPMVKTDQNRLCFYMHQFSTQIVIAKLEGLEKDIQIYALTIGNPTRGGAYTEEVALYTIQEVYKIPKNASGAVYMDMLHRIFKECLASF